MISGWTRELHLAQIAAGFAGLHEGDFLFDVLEQARLMEIGETAISSRPSGSA